MWDTIPAAQLRLNSSHSDLDGFSPIFQSRVIRSSQLIIPLPSLSNPANSVFSSTDNKNYTFMPSLSLFTDFTTTKTATQEVIIHKHFNWFSQLWQSFPTVWILSDDFRYDFEKEKFVPVSVAMCKDGSLCCT